jgi:GTP-binding protein HflX
LGIAKAGHENVIEVWNKIDLLDAENVTALQDRMTGENDPILVSAVSGQGLPELETVIEEHIAGGDNVLDVQLPIQSMGNLNWIYENTHVIEREDKEDGSLALKVRVSPQLKSDLLGRVA